MFELKEYKTQDGWNTSDTGITTEEWLQLLANESVIKEENLKWILRFYREPGHQSSCIQLSKKYKVNAQTINAYMTNCARAIQKHLNRFTITSDEAEGLHYITILVKGKNSGKSADGYLFKVREELASAFKELRRHYSAKELTYQFRTHWRALDYLLDPEDGAPMVIDAKYKPRYHYEDPEIDDLRQISAYARMEGVYKKLGIEEDRLIDCLIIYANQACENQISGPFSAIALTPITHYRRFFKIGISLPVRQ